MSVGSPSLLGFGTPGRSLSAALSLPKCDDLWSLYRRAARHSSAGSLQRSACGVLSLPGDGWGEKQPECQFRPRPAHTGVRAIHESPLHGRGQQNAWCAASRTSPGQRKQRHPTSYRPETTQGHFAVSLARSRSLIGNPRGAYHWERVPRVRGSTLRPGAGRSAGKTSQQQRPSSSHEAAPDKKWRPTRQGCRPQGRDTRPYADVGAIRESPPERAAGAHDNFRQCAKKSTRSWAQTMRRIMVSGYTVA